MPRILGACLARHFLRKLISRLFLGPGVDLEPGENAAEKALLAASMIESVIHPLHLYILYIHISIKHQRHILLYVFFFESSRCVCVRGQRSASWLQLDGCLKMWTNWMTSNFSVKDLPLEYSDALLSSSNFYLQDKMAMQEHEMRGGVLPFQLNLNLNNTYTEILFQLIPPLSLIWDRLPPHDKGCTAAIRSVDSLKSATGLGSWECRQSK